MLQNVKKNRRGFTLMELIIVVAILAILAAVAIPNYVGLINKANSAVLEGSAAELANAINIYNALNDPDITSTTGADTTLTTAGLMPTFDSSVTYSAVAGKVSIDATTHIATVN